MCGIAGIVRFSRDAEVDPAALRQMCRAMIHRGPDDEGIYAAGPVGLGMRRLSIVDLPTPLQRRWLGLDRFQRGDLQPRGASRAVDEPWPPLQHPQRHRNHRTPLRRVRTRLCPPPAWYVRLRHLGRAQSLSVYRPRSPGHQAAVLPPQLRVFSIRLRDQGHPGTPGSATRAQPLLPSRIPRFRLPLGRRHFLFRHQEAHAGTHSRTQRDRETTYLAVLGLADPGGISSPPPVLLRRNLP